MVVEEQNNRRWVDNLLRNEIRSLNVRVVELEKQVRQRTIMFLVAVAFGVLSAATAAGLAMVPYFSSSQAPAAAFLPEARPGLPQTAKNSDLPPSPDPSRSPPASSTAAPEASTELVDVPQAEALQRPVPQNALLPPEPPPAMTALGQPEEFAPPSGESDGARSGAARPATPASAEPESVDFAPDAIEPVTMPPAQSTAAAPAGRFAVYLFSVRPSTLVQSTWQRLTKRYPELASLELRATRPINVPGKGTFYAVEAGAFATRTEAQAVCDRLRPQGQSCKVLVP